MTLGDISRFFAGVAFGTPSGDASLLRDVDARVRAAVDTLPVTLFEIDANGIYTCLAGAYLALFGITPELVVGASIFDYPRFVPGKNMMVRRALAGEAVSFTGIWPRGRFLIRLVPRLDEEGRVSAVAGLGIELANPKGSDKYFEELLEALRQSEARFRAMCDCAPLGIGVANPQLELNYVNPALCAMLDRRPEQLLGRGWEASLHPEERARVHASRAEGRAPVVDGTLRFIGRAGLTVWTSLRTAAMRDDGELLGYVAAVADITQEREARLAVHAARDDLRRVIEGSPEGIAVVRDQRWVFVNAALVRTLSHADPGTLIGQEVATIVHPDDRALVAALTTATEQREDASVVRCRSAVGEYLLLEMRASPVSEFEGAPAVLISAHDVTHQKRLQARLAVTERLLAVGTLAAGVAHEINNPLAAAMCNLEWVAEQLSKAARAMSSEVDASEARRVLTRIIKPIEEAREACGRVGGIVQDLKLLSRSDAEPLGPVDLAKVLDSSVRMAWNELRHRARLVRAYGELPHVHGNEARLGQVFINLLINATQAIPEGRAEEHSIHLAAYTLPSGMVCIEVRDTGCGIPENILGRIFDPFFTTKPPGVGTGLGLSICQRLLTGMGGQIEVDSQPGRGSTFRVTLAVAEASDTGQNDAVADASRESARARVLVIDDDAAVGSALRLVLSDEHEVEVTVSARAALTRVRSGERFDAILCDLMMPELSGMDFYRELSAFQPELASQVIFLTGGAFTHGATEFLERIPNPRLSKPFQWSELRTLIARVRTAGA